MLVDEDEVYSAIGEILTDEDIERIVRDATGKDIYNDYASQNDPRKAKIQKTIKSLRVKGNHRWFLTYILFYVATQERLAQSSERISRKIVDAFPNTLIRLPNVDDQVNKLLNLVGDVFKTPLDIRRKLGLIEKEKMARFNEITRQILKLRDYTAFHETCLLLMFSLDYSESGLSDGEQPNLEAVGRQMDQVAQATPASLAALWTYENSTNASVAEMSALSQFLQNAAHDLTATTALIDQAQRIVRIYLSWLTRVIFKSVDALSFIPLIADLPDDIESLPTFGDLVQGVRDLKTTLLARVLKHKMWQDAENQITLVSKLLDAPHTLNDIGPDWLRLRSRIVWLADLEPAFQWTAEATRYADTFELKLFAERKLDESVLMLFEDYRNWLRGPLKQIDAGFKDDCLSLGRVDDPLQRLVQELVL